MGEEVGYFYLRADGRWEGRFMIGKKPTGSVRLLSVYGENREEMEEKMAAAKEAYAKKFKKTHRFVGDLPNRRYATTKVFTFRQWCQYFLKLDKEMPKRKKVTHQRYKRIINDYLIPEFGELPITLITPERVKEFLKMLTERYEKEQFKEIFLLFNRLMWKAKKSNFIRYNPYYYAWRPNQEEFFARFSMEDLLAEQSESDEFQLKAALCITQETKLQISKIKTLKWEDIDFKRRLILLNTTYQNVATEIVERKQIRMISMPDRTYQILQKLKNVDNGEFVFRRGRELWTEPRISETYIELGHEKILPMWDILDSAHLHK